MNPAKEPEEPATPQASHPFWLINVILVIAVALTWWVIHNRDVEIASRIDVKKLSYALEEQGLKYVGADSSLDPFEESLFAGGSSVKRGYTAKSDSGNNTFWLLLVQTFKDRHAHHPPEYCYTGSGWEIRSSEPGDWAFSDGNRPMVALAERIPPDGELERELIVYWFTDGNRFADSYFQRTLLDTWDRVTGNRNSWVMVLLSISIDKTQQDLSASENALRGFSESVYKTLQAPTWK